jgi:hypothetical protein
MTLVKIIAGWLLADLLFCVWWAKHQAQRKQLHAEMLSTLKAPE